MSRLKNNLFWNLLLTVSGYVFPLLTYPYVTRVLGPEGLGIANFALSVVDYAVLFSSLGIGAIGIKEIAKCGGDKEQLSIIFSRLVSLHILMTGVIAVLYAIAVIAVPELRSDLRLYVIGFCKLVFNVFLVEWLFTGIRNFRYITIRTIITRVIYVILIFLCIKEREDYWIYVAVTVVQVVLNATINWRCTSKFVQYKFDVSGIRQYIKPVFSLGINMILLSFYTSFITLYLGFACSDESVGYFSTSTKIYSIILSFISAFNGVLMPHVNYLYGQGDTERMKSTIEKSLNLVLCLSVPLAAYFLVSASDVIPLFAGAAYGRSVLPFRIIIIQVMLVGVSQVMELQILLTFNRFREILYITLSTSILSVVIMVCFARQFAEVAAACAVMIPHILECIFLFIAARRCLPFGLSFRRILIYAFTGLIIIVEYLVLRDFVESVILRITASFSISLVLFFSVLYMVKDPILGYFETEIKELIKK